MVKQAKIPSWKMDPRKKMIFYERFGRNTPIGV
jgi:hypothetical protein